MYLLASKNWEGKVVSSVRSVSCHWKIYPRFSLWSSMLQKAYRHNKQHCCIIATKPTAAREMRKPAKFEVKVKRCSFSGYKKYTVNCFSNKFNFYAAKAYTQKKNNNSPYIKPSSYKLN